MKVHWHLRLSAYTLALLGFWSVTLTEYFSPAWALAGAGMVILGWFYEGPRKHRTVYRRLWLASGLCMLLFFPFGVMLFRNLLLPAVYVAMFAQAFFLLNPKNVGVYRQMFVVSFAQLLAATNLTTGIAFAIVLTAYCTIAAYGVLLIYLVRGLQTGGEGSDTVLERQGIPRGLLWSSIVWTMILLPLTLGFFYSAPRLRYALIARGNTIDALEQLQLARQRTGFTRSVRLGSFGRIQEDQTLALRVEVPDGPIEDQNVRWRGGALNIYDGVAWSSSRDYFAYYNGRQWSTGSKNIGIVFPQKPELFILDERFAEVAGPEQLDNDPRLLKQVFYLEVPYSESIFGAGELRAVQGPFTFGVGQDFNKSYYMNNRHALPEFITYTAYSALAEPDRRALRQVSAGDFQELIENPDHGRYVRSHYLQIPPSLNKQINALAEEITRNAPGPYDKLVALENFLETQYAYSLDLGPSVDEDPLVNFLFVTRSGHCEYFATAMTIMARMLGVPSRLAKGFQRGEWNEAGGFYEVRQRDAHAWVEAFFPGYGWISFDPSPRSAADEYFQQRRSLIARAIERRLMVLQIQWRKYVVGYNETGRLRFFAEMKEFVVNDIPGAVASVLGRFAKGAARPNLLYWLVLTAIAALLGLLFSLSRKYELLPALSLPMNKLKWRNGGGTLFYGRMLNMLEKRNIVKPRHVTPREFLDYPSLRSHPMFSEIEALTSMYYRTRFGGRALERSETSAINDILKRLKQSDGHVASHGVTHRDATR